MAWELLKTDYVDAVFEGLRRYMVNENGDGSVSFSDVTNYTVKEGSFFGAEDVNKINTAVNAIMASLENGTDLYEEFTQFFETQKELFMAQSDAKQEDFETYILELEAYMSTKWDELKAEYTEDIEQYKTVQENAFNLWFQMVRDQLTSDVAGNLQNQIGDLSNLETEDKTSLTAAMNEINENYLPKTNPVAKNSFSLGRADGSTVGESSATFGKGLTASALGAIAFGLYNTVSGNGSFATGMQNNVSGLYAAAAGQSNKVSGRSAHAEGLNNYASSENQHVQGRYNKEDAAGKYAHIIGNGSSDSTRSNAHTVDWNGNAWYAGDVKATDSNGDIVSLCDCIKLVETGIITGESVMIDLKSDASYLLVTREITVSTGKIYGHRAQLMSTPKDFVTTPGRVSMASGTNSGVTIANVNDGFSYGITLTATSTYEVSYSVYELANTYGDYYSNLTGGGDVGSDG